MSSEPAYGRPLGPLTKAVWSAPQRLRVYLTRPPRLSERQISALDAKAHIGTPKTWAMWLRVPEEEVRRAFAWKQAAEAARAGRWK